MVILFVVLGALCLPPGILALVNNAQAQSFDVRYDEACLPDGNVYEFFDGSSGGGGSLPQPFTVVDVQGNEQRDTIMRLLSVPGVKVQLTGNSQGVIEEPQQAVSGTDFVCTLAFTAPLTLERMPVYVHYRLTRFWQNHRRYAKSIAVKQLRKDTLEDALNEDTGPCDPRETSLDPDDNSLSRVVPCGLRALSIFNDTYTLARGELMQAGSSGDAGLEPVAVANDTIAWATDIKTMFGATPQSDNFNTVPSAATGRTIEPFFEENLQLGTGQVSGPLEGDQRFIVWMRPGRLSSFSKLWGTIAEAPIVKGEAFVVNVTNLFNTYAFDGEKYLRFSSDGILGAGSLAWGIAFLVMAGVYWALALAIFTAERLLAKQEFGDLSRCSWNTKRVQDDW